HRFFLTQRSEPSIIEKLCDGAIAKSKNSGEEAMKSESLLPRRKFLGQLAALGLGGLACGGKLTGWLGGRPETGLSLDKATCADFSPWLGSTFRIYAEPGNAFEAKLVAARELSSSFPEQTRKPFSLVFHGEPATKSVGQVYRVEHRSLG